MAPTDRLREVQQVDAPIHHAGDPADRRFRPAARWLKDGLDPVRLNLDDVAGVAWIVPVKPWRTNLGRRPEWSLGAWLRMIAEIPVAAKGMGR